VNYIDGSWSEVDESYSRENPADVGDVVGTFPESSVEDAARAAAAAHDAFPGWRDSAALQRAEILRRAAGLLRERSEDMEHALTREEGKPLAAARGEILRTADTVDYFSGAVLRTTGLTLPSIRPGVQIMTLREPVGPCLLITPFNFPAFVSSLKLGAALAAGNTVVWKPSPFTPRTSIEITRAFVDAGLPAGVLNLVVGTSPELGSALVDDERIRAISFTGSTHVGLAIGAQAARRHVRLQQEMGGKNVLVVNDDVDAAVAAAIACDGVFGESGQKCTATGLVAIRKERLDPFLEQVEHTMSALRVGNGLRADVTIGPLINARAVERAEELVETSVRLGGTKAVGGAAVVESPTETGHFMDPCVVLVAGSDNPLRREEAFAPIMGVLAVDDLAEAYELVEGSGYGLSASILTNQLDVALDFAHRAPAGVVSVNLPTTGVEFQAPFGGWNLSGGPFTEAGPSALDFYTRSKTLAIKPTLG
jgi:aldehyde dehydrogenase (NAD+)